MANYPVVRISRGQFESAQYDEVHRLIKESAEPLVPAIKQLRGLLYYHVGVDRVTNTVVNVSIWADLDAAKQMDTLAPMLAQRPILEQAGVHFDQIANYEPLWAIQLTEQGNISGSLIPPQK
jgi:quinol monooxygenase YgiN